MNPQLLEESEKYSKFCTMAYQMYGGRLENFHDPFYIKHRDNKIIQKELKEQAELLGSNAEKEVDYISYNSGDLRPIDRLDLKQPTFYAGSVYFEPPQEIAGRVGRIFQGDKLIREYSDKSEQDDSIDVYLFEGISGETADHGGLKSPMGYVAYDRKTKEITVVFRGSRSGDLGSAAKNALFSGTGNPDWVSDLAIAGDLETCEEVIGKGKMASGFANTYLSCRKNLVSAIKQIREGDPSAKPKLVTTGHSLGGALASTMYADMKVGKLGQRLKEALKKPGSNEEKDSEFVNDLLGGAECFAISTPPICDKEATDYLEKNAIGKEVKPLKKYHRVFFGNDPVVRDANILRTLKGRRLFEYKRLLVNISGEDVDLGKYKEGKWTDIGCPHELYLVAEKLQQEIQDKLGIHKENKRYWNTINGDMEITHAAKGSEPLTPKQVATAFYQFDMEGFLTLVREIARLESHSSGDRKTRLMEYIEKIGGLLSRQKDNIGNSEEVFNEFKKNLNNIVTDLDSKVIPNKGENGLRRFFRKIKEIASSFWGIIKAVIGVPVAFFKGIYELFKFKTKTKTSDLDKKALLVVQSIDDIDKDIGSLIVDKILPFREYLGLEENNPKILQGYIEPLSKGLKSLDLKILKFKKYANKLGGGKHQEVLETCSKLRESLKECIENSKNFVANKGIKNLEQMDKLFESINKASDKFNGFESKMADYESIVQESFGKGTNIKEVGANVAMTFSGVLFKVAGSIINLIGSFKKFGNAFVGLFKSPRGTQKYMKQMLGGLSKILDKTNYNALKEVKEEMDNRQKDQGRVENTKEKLDKKLKNNPVLLKAAKEFSLYDDTIDILNQDNHNNLSQNKYKLLVGEAMCLFDNQIKILLSDKIISQANLLSDKQYKSLIKEMLLDPNIATSVQVERKISDLTGKKQFARNSREILNELENKSSELSVYVNEEPSQPKKLDRSGKSEEIAGSQWKTPFEQRRNTQAQNFTQFINALRRTSVSYEQDLKNIIPKIPIFDNEKLSELAFNSLSNKYNEVGSLLSGFIAKDGLSEQNKCLAQNMLDEARERSIRQFHEIFDNLHQKKMQKKQE